MKTTLAKTRIMILLAVFLAAPLLANLPYECAHCSGTSEDCGCNEDEQPLQKNGPPDGEVCCTDDHGPTFGSLRLTVPFGRPLHEDLELQGQFSLYAVAASPLVYTTQYLQYRNRLLDRIVQTEVAPVYCERILGANWEARLGAVSVFGRVITDDTIVGNATHRVRLVGARREAVVFQFTLNDPVGRPTGDKSTLRLTLRMRDASGGDTTSNPYYYDLLFGDGSFVRYTASDGRVVSCTTSSGRTVTPADAGLEAAWDDSGLIRQVRSERDGLADVVTTSPGTAYEIRLYALSQISGQADGLYTVTGSPHTVWRVSNPDAGMAAHVHVTRITGGAEETTVFEYSNNSEGWTKTSPDGATVISSSSETDQSRTLKSVAVTEHTRTGVVASRTLNLVRKYPFGERVVSSTRDPDGAHIQTTSEYYTDIEDAGSYGRRKSESRPDGGWTLWRYDPQGRVMAIVTPWKNAAFGSPDGLAKVVLYSYSPLDNRDTVAATDFRPRVEETKVLGVTVSKTFRAYYMENGCKVEVTERCVRPDASYGDADNLRAVRRWYPAGGGASSASAGRLHTVLGEDGLMTTYAYEYGTWSPNMDDTVPGMFTSGNGSAFRVTETHGTSVHPAGIAYRTLRLVSVMDASGNEVFSERQAYTGGGYVRIDWIARAYDFRGRLIRERRSNGELAETSWGCCAKTSEMLPDGRTYLYEYDSLKRLVSKTILGIGNQPDYVTEYEYDAAGRVSATTVSGGSLSLSLSSAYDLAGRLLSSTNVAGLVTNRTYLLGVNTGNLRHGGTVTVAHPGGAQTITANYCDGRTASVTGDAQVAEYCDYGVNEDGTQWTLVRFGTPDSPRWTKTTTGMVGRVVKVEKPGYGIDTVILTQNFHDAAGRLVKTTQTGTADVLYEYDELGELMRTGQDADGNGALDLASDDRITEIATTYMQDNDNGWWQCTERKIYATADDATATTISITDERLSGFADGVVSETRETDVHGNTSVTTVSVDRANATVVTETLSPESPVAERQVAVNGLVVSVRSKSNLTTTFGYDSLRRRVSVIAPRTGTSTVTYNAAGQISAETDAAGNTTAYGYDDAGRLAWRRNALNKYSRYAYNSYGQKTRVWGDAEYPVEYGYDQYGQKVTMTTFRTGNAWNGVAWPDPAPVGDTTTWNYDAATGLLTSKVYADGYGPSYTYTVDGKLASRTWARKDALGNDLVTAYSYNLFGEQTGVDYSDSTPDIAYAYNRFGKLSQVTDAVGTRTFTYNAMLDEISETITGLYSKTLTRTYTSTGFKGKKQGLSIDNVSHYSYGYDTYGRMNQITIPSGSFNYTRLAASDLVAQMTRPNGITTTWSYETNRDLVTQVQNGTISTYGYVNDAIGRRTSMSRSGSAYATPDAISYTYNDRSELTGGVSNVDTTYSYSYAYDPIGNRVTASEAGVPWTYTTNNLNQYTSATENNTQLSFAYDLDGSMTYRPVDATSGWTQVWNGENRMVDTTKGTDRLTFKYDYMGRRVEKCVYSNNTLTSKTFLVYDGFKCVEELDALNDNAILMRHTWQPSNVGLDIILVTTNENVTSFFLHDVNKNAMQKTAVGGILEETYSYTPFGQSISYATAHIGFSSEFFDIITALNIYNYRMLLPCLGRWTQRDPIDENDVINLYNCFDNSPIIKFDKNGLFTGKVIDLLKGEKCPKGKIWTFRNISRVPRADGCSNPFQGYFMGNVGKAIAKLIPDLPPYSGIADKPFDDVDFSGACDYHDYCYSNCEKEQKECDKGLQTRAEQSCEDTVLTKMFNTVQERKEWLDNCKKWAKAYYMAVSKFGKGSYDDRQKKACACLCPNELTQSGPTFIDDDGVLFDNPPPFE